MPEDSRGEAAPIQIVLQYFDDCPNWKTTADRLSRLVDEGMPADIEYQYIDSLETAMATGFRGSPTVLIEGVDPFGDDDPPVGLACRVYRTENGHSGSPSLNQLRDAINQARR